AGRMGTLLRDRLRLGRRRVPGHHAVERFCSMCGIAGIIHRDGPGDIGAEMTRMLQSMKHRGTDSSGFALYGPPSDLLVLRYQLNGFTGTHAIGHVRMATESDVDISGAHPYWAYPFSDIAVVHNGQLTNYHMWRRRLERSGHRFQSECDSEIIAVYLAQKMDGGLSLETAMKQSLDELDGVFTYLVVTEDSLGVAKDEMAAKPLVLYESPELVALASEEV